MSSNHKNLCRDLFGQNLHIKGKTVIDDKRNISARNGRFGNLDIKKKLDMKGNFSVKGEATFENDIDIYGQIQTIGPDSPGPCDVGYVENDVTLVNGLSRVVVWYPIEQGYCPRWKQSNLDSSDTYSTFSNGFFTGGEEAAFTFPSILKAIKDANIKQGLYPVAILTHGDGESSAADPHYAYAMTRTGEHLASHGIIAVGYSRLVAGDAGAEDISALIDYLGSSFVHSSSVDTSKVVTIGHSAGSPSSQSIAPNVNPTFTDSRVKGFVLIEGGGGLDSSTVPFLLFGRDSVYNYSSSITNAVNAGPRYFVSIPNASHLAYETSRLDMVNSLRLISLNCGSNDPLTITPGLDGVEGAFGAGPYYTTLDPHGKLAFVFWNASEFLNIPQPFVGNLREIPNKIVGVNDKLKDTDMDNDGFVDVPKYITGTATAGAATTINLSSTLSTVNKFPMTQTQYDLANKLNGFAINIISGTGAGQGRTISAWNGSASYTATVSVAWATAPDSTSVYVVTNPAQVGPHNRKWDGTFEDIGSIGFEENIKIFHMYLTAFIRSTICGDTRFDRFLTSDFATKMNSIGVGSLEIGQ